MTEERTSIKVNQFGDIALDQEVEATGKFQSPEQNLRQIDHYAQFTGAVPFVGPELVTNGDFETDLDGWSQDSGSWAQVTDESKFGSGSAEATSSESQLTQAVDNLDTSKTYALSGWVRTTESGGTDVAQVTIKGTSTDTLVDGGQEWTYVTFVFTPGSSSETVALRRETSADGPVQFDGISLIELPSAFEAESTDGWSGGGNLSLSTVDGIRGDAIKAAYSGTPGTDFGNLSITFSPQDWSQYTRVGFWAKTNEPSDAGNENVFVRIRDKQNDADITNDGFKTDGEWQFVSVPLDGDGDLSEVDFLEFHNVEGDLFIDHITLHTEDPRIGQEHGFFDAFAPEEDLVGWWKLDEAQETDGSNQVLNPGLENWTNDDPDNWSETAVSTTEETTIVRSGGSSAKVTADGSGAVNEMLEQQDLGLSGGTSYYVEVWVRTDGNSGEGARLVMVNDTDSETIELDSVGNVTEFTKISGVFFVDDGTDAWDITIRHPQNPDGGEVFYLDDVTVQEIQAKDASGEGVHATLETDDPNREATEIGVSSVRNGLGTAYNFDDGDGSGFLRSSDLSLGGGDELTLEAWVKYDSFPSSGSNLSGSIIRPHGADEFEWSLSSDDGQVKFVVRGSDDNLDTVEHNLGTGVWTHVVGVMRSDGELILYVDGQRVDSFSDTNSGRTLDSGQHAIMGAPTNFGSTGEFLDASVDEVRIYSRALGEHEVAQRFNATKQEVRGWQANDEGFSPDLETDSQIGTKALHTVTDAANDDVRKTFPAQDWTDYRFLSFWGKRVNDSETIGLVVVDEDGNSTGTIFTSAGAGAGSWTYRVTDLTRSEFDDVDLSRVTEVRLVASDDEFFVDGIKLTEAEEHGDWRLVEDADIDDSTYYVSNDAGSTSPSTDDQLTSLTFTDLPSGTYDVVVYGRSDDADLKIDVAAGGKTETVELPSPPDWSNDDPLVRLGGGFELDGDEDVDVSISSGDADPLVELDKIDFRRVAGDGEGVRKVTGTDFETVTGIEEVTQALRIRLNMRKGESLFFPDAGLPVSDIVGAFEEGVLEAVVRAEILKEPKVQSIEAIDARLVDGITRHAEISLRFTLDSGETAQTVVSVS